MAAGSSRSLSADSGQGRSILIAGGSLFLAATGCCCYYGIVRPLQARFDTMKKLRDEERRGRIRAEVKLRTALKEQQQQQQQQQYSGEPQQSNSNSNNTNIKSSAPAIRTFPMRAIGTIASPYTKRMGTPRQPQLCPSSRGFIQFESHIPPAALDGIAEYSHAWILFEFHANTNNTLDKSSKNNNNKNPNTLKQAKSKIRPPRSPHKVGQLATRSPHRPNPIGLSLVQIHDWDARLRRLHVRGLDLVQGTPVYDIKPCVPWDIPPGGDAGCVVPQWVRGDDNDDKDPIPRSPPAHRVTFTDSAAASLAHWLDRGRFQPLYTTANDAGAVALKSTIAEILAQDPRSSHTGGTATASRRGTVGTYQIILGRCAISFAVDTNAQRVQVTGVEPVDFAAESFVDGIPLVSEQGIIR